MSALVLLCDYKMKNKKALKAKRESEAPVTLEYMREFRAEMNARFEAIYAILVQMNARFEQIDRRFEQIDKRFEQVDARFDEITGKFGEVDSKFGEMNAKFDQTNARIEEVVAEMKTMNHQTKLIVEEQNTRNKQAYDGYAIAYGAIEDLRSRIKSECLK